MAPVSHAIHDRACAATSVHMWLAHTMPEASHAIHHGASAATSVHMWISLTMAPAVTPYMMECVLPHEPPQSGCTIHNGRWVGVAVHSAPK
jgi:hypothetical protein